MFGSAINLFSCLVLYFLGTAHAAFKPFAIELVGSCLFTPSPTSSSDDRCDSQLFNLLPEFKIVNNLGR